MNHDAFVNVLSYWLAKASIPHKDGWRGRPKLCEGLFTHIAHRLNLLTDNEVTDSDEPRSGRETEKVDNKIITDLVVDGRALLCAFDGIGTRLFGGCEMLIDVKTKTCDAK
jgi:hypothetical protein